MKSRLTPNSVVALLLFLWWLLNLVMAAGVELANDEAYYWWWAEGCGLDWGYYDHPPAVAFLIWLTGWMGGEFGVRLATTVLQPLYLWILWRLWAVHHRGASMPQAIMFAAICFSMPLLQLYGLLSLPDAPLLFAASLFMWFLDRLQRKPSLLGAVWVGVATAALGYSKYQGVILVATGLLLYLFYREPSGHSDGERRSHSRCFLAALWLLVAAVLYMPHLLWLYRHDFATVNYHLLERGSRAYRVSFTVEYLLNLLLVFNPLLIWFIVKGGLKKTPDNDNRFINLFMLWTLVSYTVFFFLASFRGRTQPQWNLVAVLPSVWFVMQYVDAKFGGSASKTKKPAYPLKVVVCISVVVMIGLRIMVLFNPLHLRGELWNNRSGCEAVAAVAAGRPVVVQHNYTLPCKYIFYTGRQACSIPVYYERDSQWRYTSADSSFFDQSVLVVVPDWFSSDTIVRPGVKPLHYRMVEHYLPLSRVKIRMNDIRCDGDSLFAGLTISNPYPFPIFATQGNNLRLLVSSMRTGKNEKHCEIPFTDTLPPHSIANMRCTFHIGSPASQFVSNPLRFGLKANGLIATRNVETPYLVSSHRSGK